MLRISASQHSMAGFSLMEILVSLILVSVGMLGFAGLQINSLKYNHEAYLHSVVVMQMYDMIDRMRANTAGVSAGNYNNLSSPPSGASSCNPCTASEIAQNDYYAWSTTNTSLLPSGRGTVRNLGNNVFTVTVMWDGQKTGATGTSCSGDPTVDLTCLSMTVRL